jgi:hypothetical protein
VFAGVEQRFNDAISIASRALLGLHSLTDTQPLIVN